MSDGDILNIDVSIYRYIFLAIPKFFEEQKERQDKAAVSISFLIYCKSSKQPEEHTANNAFGCYHIHQHQQQ